MTRKEQIEQLAKAWEALGDGRTSNTRFGGPYDDNRDPFGTEFLKNVNHVATLCWEGTDTDDATPCLAILRDARGEDWDLRMGHYVMPVVTPFQWWAFCIGGPGYGEAHVSGVSRIHAVTLALEAKTVRVGVE